MVENKRNQLLWDIVYNANYKVNDFYGLVFLELSDYKILSLAISELKAINEIDANSFRILKYLFYHHYTNSIKIKNLDDVHPRHIAQKFIGKKNIRLFIFKRW